MIRSEIRTLPSNILCMIDFRFVPGPWLICPPSIPEEGSSFAERETEEEARRRGMGRAAIGDQERRPGRISGRADQEEMNNGHTLVR